MKTTEIVLPFHHTTVAIIEELASFSTDPEAVKLFAKRVIMEGNFEQSICSVIAHCKRVFIRTRNFVSPETIEAWVMGSEKGTGVLTGGGTLTRKVDIDTAGEERFF